MSQVIRHFLANHKIKGFLDQEEGMALHRYALANSNNAPCLEVGSYCGLSTIYMASACKERNQSLYAVDHHRGSEEHQLGEEYHDADLFDAGIQAVDSFPIFRKNIELAELTDSVIPVVASSENVLRNWAAPLSMVFVDGGHSEAMAMSDCMGWSRFVVKGGILAIHDIFENPLEGGQGPYRAMSAVLETGEFEFVEKVKTLALLRKR